jgi:TRAP transporter TAXI family solute receptor
MTLSRSRLFLGLLFMFSSLSASAQRLPLIIGTGAAGGAFAEYGPAMGKIVAARSKVDLVPRSTDGSNENLRLVNAGTLPLALVNLGPAYQAWTGVAPFAGAPLREFRAVLPMYETPFHIIALKDSGIASVAQLDGKRVGVGPAGGPGEVFFRGLAEVANIKPVIVTGTPDAHAKQVLAREIDALWYGAGLPVAAFKGVTDNAQAVVFGPSEGQAALFRERYPYFAPYVIPANTYRGQGEAIATFAVWNFMVAHRDLSNEAVFAITEALLAHPDEVAAAYPAASATLARNAVANSFLPFHPGAARYYRERGVVLPRQLMPE